MITAGRHTVIPQDVECYAGVNLTIGNFCSIGSRLKIYSGTHACIEDPRVVSTFPFAESWNVFYPKGEMNGHVTIGHDVWIATDVKILEGVIIGVGSIVGAGSLVTKDVPPYSFVAGNPAVVKRYRFEPDTIDKLLTIKWFLWDDVKIKQAMPYMSNIKNFLQMYG